MQIMIAHVAASLAVYHCMALGSVNAETQPLSLLPVKGHLRNVSQVKVPQDIEVVHQIQVTQSKPKRQLMDMISQFRAEVCADMKDKHGKKFESYKECKKFMEEACNPGKDQMMDGDNKEITSGKGFCEEYFKVKKKEKEVEEEEKKEQKKKEEEVHVVKPAPAPVQAAPAPAPAKTVPAPAPGKAAETAALMPAPAPAAPAGPAAPAAPLPGDIAWYYKDDGKWAGRVHMNEEWKLPSQGYWGKLVEHEDGKTMNSDWGKEFGPVSGHRSYSSICHDHPQSAWCKRRGFFKKSSGYKSSMNVIALLLSLFWCGVGA